MPKHFSYRFLRTATLVFAAAVAVESLCERKCGNVDVPYPFGVDDPSCAKDGDVNFVVDCNGTYSPPKPYLRLTSSSMEVVAISLENATISVRIRNSFKCYDKFRPISNQTLNQSIALGRSSPFTFSSTENKLIGLGCDTIAFMSDADGMFGSGCISLCAKNVDFAREGSCSGLGCCKSSVPKRVKSLDIRILTMDDDKRSAFSGVSHCDFAMLVDRNSFDVTKMRLDFVLGDPEVDMASVLLDWVAGNESCEDAQAKGGASYACGPNTECSYSDSAVGYRCRCSKGFRGNPYSKGTGEGEGCQDIDECEDREKYTCEGKCKNTIGDYECKCPFLMTGDGKVNCKRSSVTTILTVVAAITFAITIALLMVLTCERRKKERVFRENGGLILKHQRVRLFSKHELAKATNNYDHNNILGQGGFATVYKGVLIDDDQTTEIAVKRPKDSNSKLDVDKKKQFHEEIAIVSQVNHVNAVKLLGLCLETKVPLLVYECVPNGTLFRHIHGKKSTLLMSWKTRLRIAVETALALDYLHSLAHPPIIHRDVKSTNILLDENFTAKVSDFGASVLVPPGQTWIATSVQGTPGYLDPEYLITGTLTTKSDVYSFGVVLVELMTGEKPISKVRTGPKSNIIQYFVTVVREKKEDYVGSIVDAEIARDEDETVQIEAVAELATRCLEISGDMRPSMKDVAEELGRLNKLNRDSRARRCCDAGTERCSFKLAEYFTQHVSFSDSSELK